MSSFTSICKACGSKFEIQNVTGAEFVAAEASWSDTHECRQKTIEEKFPAGWGWPHPTARKLHYFPEGQVRSSCGRYGRIIPISVQPNGDIIDPNDCMTCRKKAKL